MLHSFTFIDGQKIAKKLASSISKEMKKLRQFLEEYNAICCEVHEEFSPVALSEVISISSDFWGPSSCLSDSTVPWKLKKDIIQAYLVMQRSEEEMDLLKLDMQATIYYWYNRFQCISRKIKEIDSLDAENSFLRGAKCCLLRLQWKAHLYHSKALIAFSDIIEVSNEQHQLSLVDTNISSDEESDDSDND